MSPTARAAADGEGGVVERDVDCLDRHGLEAVGWRRGVGIWCSLGREEDDVFPFDGRKSRRGEEFCCREGLGREHVKFYLLSFTIYR